MNALKRPSKEPFSNFANYVNKIENKFGYDFDKFLEKQLNDKKLTPEQKQAAQNMAEISKLLTTSQPQTITDENSLNTYIQKLQTVMLEVLNNTKIPLLPNMINALQNINVPSRQSNMFLLLMTDQNVLPKASQDMLINFFNNIPENQRNSLFQQLNTTYSRLNNGKQLSETEGFKQLKRTNPILYNKITK